MAFSIVGWLPPNPGVNWEKILAREKVSVTPEVKDHLWSSSP
jgi:hypothetical protein